MANVWWTSNIVLKYSHRNSRNTASERQTSRRDQHHHNQQSVTITIVPWVSCEFVDLKLSNVAHAFRAFGSWATFDHFRPTNSHDARSIRHNLYIVTLAVRSVQTALQDVDSRVSLSISTLAAVVHYRAQHTVPAQAQARPYVRKQSDCCEINATCRYLWAGERVNSRPYHVSSLVLQTHHQSAIQYTDRQISHLCQLFTVKNLLLSAIGKTRSSVVADMPPERLYERIRQRPPHATMRITYPQHLMPPRCPRAIGFVSGIEKLKQLGYNLVMVARWSTQTFRHNTVNTSTWQTHRPTDVATAIVALTHCVRAATINI